jgi:hypothetical protein
MISVLSSGKSALSCCLMKNLPLFEAILPVKKSIKKMQTITTTVRGMLEATIAVKVEIIVTAEEIT